MKTLLLFCLLIFTFNCHAKEYIKAGVLVNGALENHGLINGDTNVPLTMIFDIENITKIGVRDLNKSCKNGKDLLFYIRLEKGNNIKKLTAAILKPCYKGEHKKGLKLLIIVIADEKKYTKEISLDVLADSYILK